MCTLVARSCGCVREIPLCLCRWVCATILTCNSAKSLYGPGDPTDGCTASPNDELKFDKTAGTLTANSLCFGVEADDPAGATFQSTLQAWAKPLNGTQGVALLMINPDTKPHDFAVPVAKLPVLSASLGEIFASGPAHNHGKTLQVRDIWNRKDLSPLAAGASDVKMTVGPMDSAFLRLY